MNSLHCLLAGVYEKVLTFEVFPQGSPEVIGVELVPQKITQWGLYVLGVKFGEKIGGLLDKVETFSGEKGIGFFLVGDSTGDGGTRPEGYAV